MEKKNTGKTLVTAAHPAGPMRNGEGNCYARCGTGGVCPGVQNAKWLNGLGADDEPYGSWPSGKAHMTNGEVRDNWLRGNSHVVAADPHLAGLLRRMRELRSELRRLGRDVAQARASAEGRV